MSEKFLLKFYLYLYIRDFIILLTLLTDGDIMTMCNSDHLFHVQNLFNGGIIFEQSKETHQHASRDSDGNVGCTGVGYCFGS